MMISGKLRVALLAVPVLLWCCAAAPPREQVEASVKARAAAYWEHRVKGRFSKAYEFESPQFRGVVTMETYFKSVAAGSVILTAEVKSVSLDRDTAVVTLALAYKPGLSSVTPKGGLKRELPDYWSLMDGVWYHRMRDPRNYNK